MSSQERKTGANPNNHTKWACPKCPFKLTTLPTPYPPTHRCTPATKTTTTLKAVK